MQHIYAFYRITYYTKGTERWVDIVSRRSGERVSISHRRWKSRLRRHGGVTAAAAALLLETPPLTDTKP